MTAADHADTIRKAHAQAMEALGADVHGYSGPAIRDWEKELDVAVDALQAQAEKAVWLEDELDECDKRADRAEAYGDEIAGTLGRKAVLLEEVATERDRLRAALRQISTTPRRPSAIAIARAALAETEHTP